MARDYRREEARRNELARERGYKSRAEQRHKSETERAAERAGFDTASEFTAAKREASSWSRKHSHVSATKYRPSESPETFGRYYRAFVEPPFGEHWSSRDDFRDYMMEDMGYSEDEFDAKYGASSAE